MDNLFLKIKRIFGITVDFFLSWNMRTECVLKKSFTTIPTWIHWTWKFQVLKFNEEKLLKLKRELLLCRFMTSEIGPSFYIESSLFNFQQRFAKCHWQDRTNCCFLITPIKHCESDLNFRLELWFVISLWFQLESLSHELWSLEN